MKTQHHRTFAPGAGTRLASALALAAVLLLTLATAAPASAQDHDWEITPTYGYRFGGDFSSDFFDIFIDLQLDESPSYGLTVERRLTDNLRFELLWSHQETELIEDDFFFFGNSEVLFDIDVDYYHAGLMYQWNAGKIRPFVIGSLGATRLDPAPSDLGSETRPSASIGGGAKFMFSDNVGLRLEGRFFGTFFEDDEDFYCRRSCDHNEDYMFQSEARAGLILAF